MSSIVARTGRHLQRYDNNLRLVSGCIPYRVANCEDQHVNMESKIKVLMVSSPNRDDMVFPKGGWESDETVEEAACREALEEAGVRGILKRNPLGVWEFRSKSKQEACSEEGGCKGYMFALEVTEELDAWPEQNNRNRNWMMIEEAFISCRYEWMRSALREFVRMMEEGKDEREHKKLVEVKEEILEEVGRPMTQHPAEHDDGDRDCQLMSTNCHVKPVNRLMSTSFGIML